ncbi:MAG TPA: hypothetical protein VKM72_08785 [Thermoanaerobaculia bacterium]|nr:hypothetical protein [Thermoanaerobaculia bacterium]
MAYLVLVKLAITFVPDAFRSTAQAAVFAWPMITILTVLGLGGLWLARRVGLPGFWNPDLPASRKWLLPVLLGVGFGALAIGVDVATGWTDVIERKLGIPSIHIDFPASLLIYPGGAIIVNVIYYLIPIPLLVWLVSGVILRGRFREQVYWSVAAIAAAIEPLTQDLSYPGPVWVMLLVLLSDYALNFAQVALFRRGGFFATVLLRVSFYLIWHVAWGLL